MEADPRIQLLAGRVRWLDRHRRKVAILIAASFAAFGVVALPAIIGWIAVPAAVVLALVIEVGLAAVLAVWETQHAHLLADRGLPRAELRRK